MDGYLDKKRGGGSCGEKRKTRKQEKELRKPARVWMHLNIFFVVFSCLIVFRNRPFTLSSLSKKYFPLSSYSAPLRSPPCQLPTTKKKKNKKNSRKMQRRASRLTRAEIVLPTRKMSFFGLPSRNLSPEAHEPSNAVNHAKILQSKVLPGDRELPLSNLVTCMCPLNSSTHNKWVLLWKSYKLRFIIPLFHVVTVTKS